MQVDSEPTTKRSGYNALTQQLLERMRDRPQPSPFMRRVRKAADYAETALLASAVTTVLFCTACGVFLPPFALLALLRYLGVV